MNKEFIETVDAEVAVVAQYEDPALLDGHEERAFGPLLFLEIGLGEPAVIKPDVPLRDPKEVAAYADYALDVVGVHGVGGLRGALATGLFATVAVNPAGADGLFYGNPGQLVIQAAGAGAVIIYSLILSVIILKIVDAMT